jgi:hypothetical protein
MSLKSFHCNSKQMAGISKCNLRIWNCGTMWRERLQLALRATAHLAPKNSIGTFNAADTREGIIDWWLPIEQRALDRAVIERALGMLVAEGLLVSTRLVDGTALYRRAKAS